MSDASIKTINFEIGSEDNVVLPFRVETGGAHGRMVQLGSVVDDILTAHDHPEQIAILLGEAIALTALLGTALKFDGKLIFQLQGKSAVKLLVVDYLSSGKLRGYINYDETQLTEIEEGSGFEPLIGKATMVITIDQGPDMERYQGIVAIEGQNLAEAAETYFQQSEQIASFIRLAAGKHFSSDQQDGDSEWHWRAGGLIVQNLAREGGASETQSETRLQSDTETEEQEHQDASRDEKTEDWQRLLILASTVESHELLDPLLSPERLAYRLFHEDGVRVYDHISLDSYCQCSAEKIKSFLGQFTVEEINDMDEQGEITVACEFCNTTYRFETAQFR